jgi:hypothetical protein
MTIPWISEAELLAFLILLILADATATWLERRR